MWLCLLIWLELICLFDIRSKKEKNNIPTKETPDQNGDQLSDDFDDIVQSSAFG